MFNIIRNSFRHIDLKIIYLNVKFKVVTENVTDMTNKVSSTSISYLAFHVQIGLFPRDGQSYYCRNKSYTYRT